MAADILEDFNIPNPLGSSQGGWLSLGGVDYDKQQSSKDAATLLPSALRDPSDLQQ